MKAAISLRVNSAEEARTVRRIYDSYAEGVSFTAIADRLTAEQEQTTTKPKTATRAVIYARTATADQDGHTFAIQSQIHACRKYAKERGYEVADEYQDQGVAGTRLERPGLTALRDAVTRGGIGVVIICDLARLARHAADLVRLQDELTRAGVTIECVR